MSYSQPRDRLELRLKEIVDNTILDSTDRRTRFDAFLAAIVDQELAPGPDRSRIELYLDELAGRASGGANLQQKTLLLGSGAPGDVTPDTGYDGLSKVIVNTSGVFPGSIRAGATVVGVSGTYAGIIPSGSISISANGTYDVTDKATAVVNVQGGVSLQAKTVALGSSAPAAVSADAGYEGLSTVSFTTSNIQASDIRSGAAILGIAGSYTGSSTLNVDTRMFAPPIWPTQTVNLGWRPDRVIISYTEYDPGADPDPTTTPHVVILTDSGLIDGDNANTVTFTSTGYSIKTEGSSWNDYPEFFSYVTVTAIKLS